MSQFVEVDVNKLVSEFVNNIVVFNEKIFSDILIKVDKSNIENKGEIIIKFMDLSKDINIKHKVFESGIYDVLKAIEVYRQYVQSIIDNKNDNRLIQLMYESTFNIFDDLIIAINHERYDCNTKKVIVNIIEDVKQSRLSNVKKN